MVTTDEPDVSHLKKTGAPIPMKMLPDEKNEEDEGSEGEDSMEEDSIAPLNEIPVEEMISPTSSWSTSSTGTLAFLLLHTPSYMDPLLLSLPSKKTDNYINKNPSIP
jgi:hypothetical protein